MIKKDSFIVYRSFYIGLKALTQKDRLQLYDAIFEYGLNSTEIELKPLPRAMFLMIKPQLQANHRKFINGSKGGRPANQKITNAEPNDNLGLTKPEPNVNDNVNENVNVKCKILMPLKSGEEYRLTNLLIDELNKTYPTINIDHELQKMRTWLISNPEKQKTARGTPKFVSNWLGKVKPEPKVMDSYADIHQAVLDARNVR